MQTITLIESDKIFPFESEESKADFIYRRFPHLVRRILIKFFIKNNIDIKNKEELGKYHPSDSEISEFKEIIIKSLKKRGLIEYISFYLRKGSFVDTVLIIKLPKKGSYVDYHRLCLCLRDKFYFYKKIPHKYLGFKFQPLD